MKKSTQQNIVNATLSAIAIAALVMVMWVIPSYFEARAYNRITGENISTLDAMFVSLRVQGSVKQDD